MPLPRKFKSLINVFKKILPLLASISMLGYVIYFTTPPNTWQEASDIQILSVFLPILGLVTFLADLIIGYLPRSFIIGLGVNVLLVLKVLGFLNPLSAIATILITVLLFRLTPKPKNYIPRSQKHAQTKNLKKDDTDNLLTKLKKIGN
jgi:hypothetical protein